MLRTILLQRSEAAGRGTNRERPVTPKKQLTPRELRAVVLRSATARDTALVEGLLTASGLPTDGVREALAGFIVAEHGRELAGAAGLERFGDVALLRSVVVARPSRGGGLGKQLVQQVLAGALANGVHEVYLLTTTAAGYFPDFGFVTIARDDVAEPIQQSIEFRAACPASAVAMRLMLGMEQAPTADA
ncbi:MAG: hypothetical protein NVS4B3_01150 [Gemmatimonadaceae bacterium]